MNLLENRTLLRELLLEGDRLNTVGGGVVEARTDFDVSEHGYVLSMRVPSIDAEALEVTLRGNRLMIVARSFQYDVVSNEETVLTLFAKPFLLPENVDFEKVEAIYQGGELRIILPYSGQANVQDRKIDIKIF